MEKFLVYYTQNLLNLKKGYVGMTNGKRKDYLGSDFDLKNDIKLLGRNNFVKTVLGEFNDWKECHYWEGFYIRTLKTHVSQGGYNKSWTGGRYTLMTAKHKKKLSKALQGNTNGSGNKGKRYNEEINKKKGKKGPQLNRRGIPAWNKGKTKYTDERVAKYAKTKEVKKETRGRKPKK